MTTEEWFEEKLEETVRRLLITEDFIDQCASRFVESEQFRKELISAAVPYLTESAPEEVLDGLANHLADYINMDSLAAAVAKVIDPSAIGEKLVEDASEAIDVDYEALAASLLRRIGGRAQS